LRGALRQAQDKLRDEAISVKPGLRLLRSLWSLAMTKCDIVQSRKCSQLPGNCQMPGTKGINVSGLTSPLGIVALSATSLDQNASASTLPNCLPRGRLNHSGHNKKSEDKSSLFSTRQSPSLKPFVPLGAGFGADSRRDPALLSPSDVDAKGDDRHAQQEDKAGCQFLG
jgi:hypothetical protein